MDKKEFRAEIRKKIAALDEIYIAESDQGIYEKLISMPQLMAAKRIFLFRSIGREPDTLRLLDFCTKKGIPFALPRTRPGGVMDFAPAEDYPRCLVPGLLGIPEPGADIAAVQPTENDVIIVPALCYDTGLYRVGQGGGYYDRFLTCCSALSIGLCREALICKELPRQAHDISVDLLVTEKKVRNR